VLVLLACLAGFALLYGTARHDISTRRAKAASLAVQTKQAQAMAAQLAPYTSFLALREQRTQAVSELAQSRFDWAYAFHELGRVLPKDASISSLNGSVGSTGGSSSSSSASSSAGSAAVTSATPPGSVPTFTLSGCATSQAEVAQTLNRLRLIDGVSEVTLQSSAKANSSGSAAAGSGGCPNGAPAFNATVIFDPLPPVSTATLPSANPATPTGAAG
jgi:Tfp pilus assembly protein PilN